MASGKIAQRDGVDGLVVARADGDRVGTRCARNDRDRRGVIGCGADIPIGRPQWLQHADAGGIRQHIGGCRRHHRQAAPAHTLIEPNRLQPAQVCVARHCALAPAFHQDQPRVQRHIGGVVEATKHVAVPVAHLVLPFAGVAWTGAGAIGVGGEHLRPVHLMQRDERRGGGMDTLEALRCMNAGDGQQVMLVRCVPCLPFRATLGCQQRHFHHVDHCGWFLPERRTVIVRLPTPPRRRASQPRRLRPAS